MSKLVVVDHPLIQHKLSIMRNEETSCKDFRELLEEIAMFMAYEVTRDLPLQEIEVKTPICTAKCNIIAGKAMVIVPILRAGLGMVNGLLQLVPAAKVGHIGLYRDHETHKPIEYYCKLPGGLEQRDVLVVDPMLATGGSAVDAVNSVKKRGGKRIKFMCLVAAPEGIAALQQAHPDVDIYTAAVDECLNDTAYIVPGLGDAGPDIRNTVTRRKKSKGLGFFF